MRSGPGLRAPPGQSDLPAASFRRNATCALCHQRTDPFGFAPEGFDAIGRRREADLGRRPVATRTKASSRNNLPGGDGLSGAARSSHLRPGTREPSPGTDRERRNPASGSTLRPASVMARTRPVGEAYPVASRCARGRTRPKPSRLVSTAAPPGGLPPAGPRPAVCPGERAPGRAGRWCYQGELASPGGRPGHRVGVGQTHRTRRSGSRGW